MESADKEVKVQQIRAPKKPKPAEAKKKAEAKKNAETLMGLGSLREQVDTITAKMRERMSAMGPVPPEKTQEEKDAMYAKFEAAYGTEKASDEGQTKVLMSCILGIILDKKLQAGAGAA